jgi:hypothetical protein
VTTRAITALALPIRAADRARLYYLRALGPLAKPLVRSRELRVAVAGVSLMVVCFAAATLFPLWLLALGPIVWGVPHVLSDIRYLWVRPGFHRRWLVWIAVGVPLLALSYTADITWGLGAALAAVLVARAPIWKKAIGVAIVAPLMIASRIEPYLSAIVFAHAHNFIGVALWWSWRKRAGKLHWLPLAVFAICAIAIMAGAIDPIVLRTDQLEAHPGGMNLYYHLASLAPPRSPGMWGVRLVLLFAFAQSVHYVIWVRLVPEEDRPRETPRTFAASLRALRDDLSWPVLAITAIFAGGLAIWAAIDLFDARTGYLRGVLFHGHLELCATALFLLEGRIPFGERAVSARAPA